MIDISKMLDVLMTLAAGNLGGSREQKGVQYKQKVCREYELSYT